MPDKMVAALDGTAEDDNNAEPWARSAPLGAQLMAEFSQLTIMCSPLFLFARMMTASNN